jgi:hypothetical protein
MARMRWSALIVSAALAGGCGSGGEDPAGSAAPPTPSATRAPTPDRATVRRARCAAGEENCAAVTGRVIYVEAVDPDGDGDAHYVLAGGNVTAPGVSVIDVRVGLRPRRLPRPGELVSAAGPVYEGSHDQRQIQATVVNHQRRR